MMMSSRNQEDAIPARKSSPLLIAAAWALVIAPTLWGLTFTVENALKIFSAQVPAAAAPARTAVAPAK